MSARALIFHMSIPCDKTFPWVLNLPTGIKIFVLVDLAIFGIGHYRGHYCFTNTSCSYLLCISMQKKNIFKEKDVLLFKILCIKNGQIVSGQLQIGSHDICSPLPSKLYKGQYYIMYCDNAVFCVQFQLSCQVQDTN